MHGPSYQQKVAFINERDRQSRLNDDNGEGGSFGGIIVLIELFLAFALGMTVLDNLGSEALRAVKYSALWAGIAGVVVYFILLNIPGVRWLMKLSLILLWAFFAYTIGIMVIGDDSEGFHFVAHKGPYIAAAVVGFIRAFI